MTMLGASGATRAIAAAIPPTPTATPFDHVVVLMMENRSFDHLLGWLPGAHGRQAGLSYTDLTGTTYPTYRLAPDFQGCGYADPDHSWQGGQVQLNGGRCDGFLRTPSNRIPKDTFPIGYYTEPDIPVVAALARSYTTLDRYFAATLNATYPNRFYMHAARTDRDTNTTTTSTLPTIWDRIAAAGLSGRYYASDLPFLALWGTRYASITRPFDAFLADAAAGSLPNLAFVDPSFNGESQGVSGDDHPNSDVRSGDAFIASVYHAVRQSPNWDRTVLVLNFDEWGGFYDHVRPPRVIDDTVPPPGTGPHPDYRQLGFRVPCVVISPFSPARVVSAGPYEHTSILRMVEWRWGLAPLAARDANARNLAGVLDFRHRRTDQPAVPSPGPVVSAPCSPLSTKPSPPTPVGGH
jgi:phospholipase C